MSYMMAETSVLRAAVVVAAAAVLEAVVGPFLAFGWISPKFVIIAVVFAVSGLRELQAVLLGFFGGTLVDALGGGLFGVGALGGLIAATLSTRVGAARLKNAQRFLLAQVAGISVFAYDLISLTSLKLTTATGPAVGEYIVGGALPDALLNVVLAYLLGGWLLNVVRSRETS